MMPVAILDFGTNTFNLLIAEAEGNSFKRLYSGKQPVKLGRGGIQKRTITQDAMERGFTAIQNHMAVISEFGVKEIHAYATSAIRNADNGGDFVREVKRRFGFDIQVIPGEQEAQLIYKGITKSIDFKDKTALILDIGGGSNEFIICNRNGIHWKHSFELGMARIVEKFNISDPITALEVAGIEDFYQSELQLLMEKVKIFKPTILIGASGSFDTIAAMIRNGNNNGSMNPSSMEISIQDYKAVHRRLVKSTLKEREVMPGMEPVRLEMIVPATIFINFVIGQCGLKAIHQSDYALKEGVMATLLES